MAFIKTSRLTHYVEQSGDGAPLLVLNGSGADLRIKPNIIDSPLRAHFAVTVHDQRGLGQTDKPEGAYTMADYADDAAALMDVLGFDTAMVLGISFGGMVGQEMAIRHPDRITKLALWCTAPGGAGGASYPLHELADLDDETRLRTMMKLNDARVDDAFIADNPKMLDMARQRNDLSAYQHEPGWAEGRAAQLAARAQHDCWDRLDQITCPTRLGGGKYDNIAKPEAMRAMASRIPQSQLSLYEGGHLFMLQDAQAFADIIGFFEEDSA
jgi:3-oxoadipate enol-lactonase